MNYLLDTNACIAIINGRPASVRERLGHALAADARVWVSSIVAFELWYGVGKSSRLEATAREVESFFAGPVALLPFDDEDARAAGNIRAELETIGRPIGAYDLLIAGQALQRKLTLVTSNVAEFRRIKGLDWQDWAKG